MLTATVTTTHDAGQPSAITDEYGNVWRNAIDGADGTFAVEEVNGERAGIASWMLGDSISIAVSKDGDYYGVNCTEEYIARGGEWVQNDLVEA